MTWGKSRTIRYVPGQERHDWTGHAFLLARDIPLGIMPTWHLRRDGFSVDMVACDEESKKLLRTLLEETGHYDPRTLAEAVCDFVESAAQLIGYTGQAAFEICRGDDGLKLIPITAGRLTSIAGFHWQRFPRGRTDDGDVGAAATKPRRHVRLARGSVWKLKLPRELGTSRQHRRLLSRLERSSRVAPDFTRRTANLGRNFGYDFVAHRDASDRLQERLTRRWGTVLSIQRPVGTSSEYFFIARRLAFHRAQALLREHLISSLNKLLPSLSIQGRIVVTGLPSADQIADTLELLHAGECSFGDALDVVRL